MEVSEIVTKGKGAPRSALMLLDKNEKLIWSVPRKGSKTMKTVITVTALLALIVVEGCVTSTSRVAGYLSGFQTLPATSPQPQQLSKPLLAGIVLVLPETEVSKPTTPSSATLEQVAGRIQKELQQSSNIMIQQIFPPTTIPANGLAGLSLERLRDITKERKFSTMVVVVATSSFVSKMRFWPIQENQLYVRMDAALVDVSAGLVLMTELGQDDYVMAQNVDYVDRISYPRLYYRTFTVGGPFTIVKGDPYRALGEQAFRDAADQLGMKLRQRLSPEAVS